MNLNYKIISKDMQPLCPVDYCGRFIDPVTDFKGQYVKVTMKVYSSHVPVFEKKLCNYYVFIKL